jgi:hypothetical protein
MFFSAASPIPDIVRRTRRLQAQFRVTEDGAAGTLFLPSDKDETMNCELAHPIEQVAIDQYEADGAVCIRGS